MSAVRLGDHAKLIRGITFKPVDKCDPGDEGAVVCMRTKNVQATLDASDLIAVPSRLVKNPEKMLSTGDILISSANSWNLVGKCCQVPQLQYPSTAGGFISILRPKTEKLESSYLYRWFSWGKIQRTLRSFGNQTTNISNLDHKKTLELQIQLPPLAEQKRIARILDAADALRAKRREALAQLDTLLQSTFLDMFGDPVANPMGWVAPPLADFCTTGTGGTPSRGKMQRYYEGGTIPWVKSGELREEVITSTGERITETALKETHVKLVPKDALLLALYGATVGRLGILGIQATTNQAVCHIIPNSLRVDLRYMFHSLLNQVSYLVGRGVGGAQPNISQGIIKSLAIPLPPLDLQHHFAAIVQSVEQQKTSQRAHRAELDTLFASLQSRAFQGDL